MPEPDSIRSLTSPNGDYRADLLTWAGGGGLSPYCYETLLVTPVTVSVQQAESQPRYEVYSGGCGDFSDHSSSPKVSWITNNKIHVSISINETSKFPMTVKLKKTDATDTVQVVFDAEE